MDAAVKSNIKTISLELRGKSSLIIFDDANLDMAAGLASAIIFFNKI